MKKSGIYVEITSEKERLEVVEILQNAKQIIDVDSSILVEYKEDMFANFDKEDFCWVWGNNRGRKKITIPQLKKLLQPKTADQLIEKFKKKMAKKGFKVDVVFENIEL